MKEKISKNILETFNIKKLLNKNNFSRKYHIFIRS